MTDTLLQTPPAAAPGAAPAPVVPAASGGNPPPSPAPAGASGVPPVVDPAAPPASGADDWRKPMAGEDADILKELARYNTQSDVAKALVEAKKTIRKGDEGKVKLLGENATPDDIAAFNKAFGIPEAPDKYERVTPPEGLEITDGDQEFIDGAITELHKMGGEVASPKVIKTFEGLYHKAMQDRAAHMAAAAVTAAQTTDKQLKTEWGAEHKINFTYANTALAAYAPGGTADEMLNLQLADGTKLGAYAPFIKMMASAGRATTEDAAFLATLNGGEGLSADAVDTEIAQIKALRTTDSKAYDAKSERLSTLLEMQRRRNQGQKA